MFDGVVPGLLDTGLEFVNNVLECQADFRMQEFLWHPHFLQQKKRKCYPELIADDVDWDRRHRRRPLLVIRYVPHKVLSDSPTEVQLSPDRTYTEHAK